MDKIFKKTIIHEIGHYTARTLNQEIYSIGEGVEKVEFEKKNAVEYEGRTIPIKPKYYRITDPIINLAEYISVLYYGCIFQSIYFGEKFSDCFAIDKNGENDVSAYSFHTNDLDKRKRIKISSYFTEYYIPLLEDNKDHLVEIFEKDYSNLLQIKPLGYSMEMKKLRKDLNNFLDEHTDFYKELIIKIRTIINER